MLDSILAMKRVALLLFAFFSLIGPIPARAQFTLISIESPVAGQALMGAVTVTGTSAMPDFASAEVSFAYPNDPTGTWFLVAQSDQPVQDSTLAVWDTTLLTDGTYILRLRVTLTDGTTRDVSVTNLRVRNYTPLETATPFPVDAPQATPRPTTAPTSTLYPTPTALPPNPAEVTPSVVRASLLYGGLAALGLFLLVGAYLRLRRN